MDTHRRGLHLGSYRPHSNGRSVFGRRDGTGKGRGGGTRVVAYGVYKVGLCDDEVSAPASYLSFLGSVRLMVGIARYFGLGRHLLRDVWSIRLRVCRATFRRPRSR